MPEKRELGGPRNRWENNIKMDLKKYMSSGLNSFDSVKVQ